MLYLDSQFEFITSLGKYAGVGGISVGVLFLIFKNILGQTKLFSALTPEQKFRLLRTIILCAFGIGVVGIGAWAFGPKRTSEASVVLAGTVKEKSAPYKEIADATIKALELSQPQPRAEDRSTNSGSFYLQIKNAGDRIRVHVSHPKYEDWEEWVGVPQENYVVTLTPKSSQTTTTTTTDHSSSSNGSAADCPPEQRISPEQAAACQGTEKSVCGQLAGVYKKAGNTYLNFGANFPDQTFSAVVWTDAVGQAKTFQVGQKVCIIGRIEMYNHKPEIKIKNWENVTVEGAT